MDSRNSNISRHPDSFRITEDVIEEEERDEFNIEDEQRPIFRPRQPSTLLRGPAAPHRKGSIKASAVMDDNDDSNKETDISGKRPPRRHSVEISGLDRRGSRRKTMPSDTEQQLLNQVLAKYSDPDENSDAKKESRKQIRKMLEGEAKIEETKKKAEKERSLSLVFQRKQMYTQLSLFFGLLLFVIIVYEMICLLIYEKTPATTRYLASFLILHVISFHLFVLGLIYANESGNVPSFLWASLAGVLNLAAFGLRVNYQFQYDSLISKTAYINL